MPRKKFDVDKNEPSAPVLVPPILFFDIVWPCPPNKEIAVRALVRGAVW
jgi:hypothetical protein